MSTLWVIGYDAVVSEATHAIEIKNRDIDTLSCESLEKISDIGNHENNGFNFATNTDDIAMLACWKGKPGVHIYESSGNIKQYIEISRKIYGIITSSSGRYFAVNYNGWFE